MIHNQKSYSVLVDSLLKIGYKKFEIISPKHGRNQNREGWYVILKEGEEERLLYLGVNRERSIEAVRAGRLMSHKSYPTPEVKYYPINQKTIYSTMAKNLNRNGFGVEGYVVTSDDTGYYLNFNGKKYYMGKTHIIATRYAKSIKREDSLFD